MSCEEALRVCHITSVHNWQDTRIFLKECASLARAGYEVHLIAPGAPGGTQRGVTLHGVQKRHGSRLLRCTKTTYEVFRRALELDAAVYHFHDAELIPAALALKSRGKKVIYDTHEDLPRQLLGKGYIPKFVRAPCSRVCEWVESFASRRFDAIVAATPAIAERFVAINANTTNVNNYPIQEELAAPVGAWEGKERSVCYVGAFQEIKGLVDIVRAIGLTDVTLLLGGQFDSVELKSRVEALPGWKNVRHLGHLDRAAVGQAMARSVAGLVLFHPVPNYVDARPIKMFEYMSAGIPVIASHFPAWKVIIEGSGCGLCVDPFDPTAISEAIRYLVDNPTVAQEMGRKGREAIETRYNWALESDRLLQVYRAL